MQLAAATFEPGALDYLLQPFCAERLALTLDLVRAMIGNSDIALAVDRYCESLRSVPIS